MTNKINSFLWWTLFLGLSATTVLADCNRDRAIRIIGDNGEVSCGSINSCDVVNNCIWDWTSSTEYFERQDEIRDCALDALDQSLSKQWLTQPDIPIIHDEWTWERDILGFQDPTTAWTIAPKWVDVNDHIGQLENACTVIPLS